MNKLENKITELEKNFFGDKLADFNNGFNELVNEISKFSEKFKGDVLFDEILRLINVGIENKDFLLLLDILRYEFLPFIDKNYVYGEEN